MGKKAKAGKQRKDKFYHLAKETGYRARSAFKLIQLNRKFEFLQNSRVLIDLCAAPGGWLQVAREHMPVSSLILGVDLFPIKAIPNVITLQEDITTDKCRQNLRKEIKTWDADVVLHDGAPNVGKNWLHDAFQQSQLTLAALRLATKFLRKGGWFVTKVFRSKDYHSLLFVLKKLFKKVYSTKPQASRKESAEIFVVCQNYLAPSKMDPKFLDEKYVFEELEAEPKKVVNLFKPPKAKKKPEGYPEGQSYIHEDVKASYFVEAENYMELLSKATKIEIDEDWIKNHSSTTSEIVECCKDVKLLGRPELKALLAWRKKLNAEIEKNKQNEEKVVEKKEVDEEEELDKQIAQLKAEEERDLKRKKKQVAKERQKLVQRLNLKMTLKDDEPLVAEDASMFDLKAIKTREGIDEINEQSADIVVDEDEDDVDSDTEIRPQFEKYNKNTDMLDDSGRFYRKAEDPESEDDEDDDVDSEEELEKKGLAFSDSENEEKMNEDDEGDVGDEENNPLIVDMQESGKDAKKKRRAEVWFERDIFQSFNDESDEDFEVDAMVSQYSKMGGSILSKAESDLESGYTSDHDQEFEQNEKVVEESQATKQNIASESDSDTSDSEVEETEPRTAGEKGKKRKKGTLNAHALALGTMMIKSKKSKRDIVDDGWNRHVYNDEGLPDWFVRDEAKHMKKPPPVDSEVLQEVQERLKEVNVRTIKKVVEAKARKKKRRMKRLERIKKKAETVCDSIDMSDKEKVHAIRQLYKKADPKKKEVKYIVAKKKNITGKRIARPPGVKGPYKIVDSRMKKDLRNNKIREKKKGKRKGRRKGK